MEISRLQISKKLKQLKRITGRFKTETAKTRNRKIQSLPSSWKSTLLLFQKKKKAKQFPFKFGIRIKRQQKWNIEILENKKNTWTSNTDIFGRKKTLIFDKETTKPAKRKPLTNQAAISNPKSTKSERERENIAAYPRRNRAWAQWIECGFSRTQARWWKDRPWITRTSLCSRRTPTSPPS